MSHASHIRTGIESWAPSICKAEHTLFDLGRAHTADSTVAALFIGERNQHTCAALTLKGKWVVVLCFCIVVCLFLSSFSGIKPAQSDALSNSCFMAVHRASVLVSRHTKHTPSLHHRLLLMPFLQCAVISKSMKHPCLVLALYSSLILTAGEVFALPRRTAVCR